MDLAYCVRLSELIVKVRDTKLCVRGIVKLFCVLGFSAYDRNPQDTGHRDPKICFFVVNNARAATAFHSAFSEGLTLLSERLQHPHQSLRSDMLNSTAEDATLSTYQHYGGAADRYHAQRRQ